MGVSNKYGQWRKLFSGLCRFRYWIWIGSWNGDERMKIKELKKIINLFDEYKNDKVVSEIIEDYTYNEFIEYAQKKL